MSLIRSVVKSTAAYNNLQVVARRNISATPPRIRVSFAEKVAHCTFMTVAMLAYPTWVLAKWDDLIGKEQK